MFSIISILALFGRFPVNFYDVTIKSFPNYKDTESEAAPCVRFIQYVEKQSNQDENISEDLSFCTEVFEIFTARENSQTLTVMNRVDTSTAGSVPFVNGLTAKT